MKGTNVKKKILGAVLACAMTLSMAFLLTGCDNPFAKKSYTPEGKSATVSSPAIGKDGVLRVGVNTSNPPMAGSASKIVGIDVDIAAAIADEWGLKLEITDVGSSPLSALKNKQVDLVLGVATSNTETELWKSAEYLQTGVALFSKDAKAAAPTKESKIVAQGASMSAWKASSLFGSDALVNASDLKGAFEKLAGGTVQYVASDAVIGQYAAYTTNVEAHVVALMEKPTGYCAATLATNKDLSDKLTSVLQTLTKNGTIGVIEKKWLGTELSLSKVTVLSVPGEKEGEASGSASASASASGSATNAQ